MGIINVGVKHSPPNGFDMKKASPVIEKLTTFLKTHGRGDNLEADE